MPRSKDADAARKREERGGEACAQEKLALQSEVKPAARDRSTRIAERIIEAQAQAAAKRTQQAEAKPAACCAKVMNEFVKTSGKPPTLRDIRQVILPKVNAERELRKKPPILESTLVKHIRKWKQSAGYTWPGRKHQKTDDDSPDLRDLMNFFLGNAALDTVACRYSSLRARQQRQRACHGSTDWPVRRFRTRADLCRSEPSHKALRSLPHWS